MIHSYDGPAGDGFVSLGTGLRYVEQVTGRMTTGRATLMGATQGAALGAISHAATRGMRDFASVAGMQANRYEVVVDDGLADRAASILRCDRPDQH